MSFSLDDEILFWVWWGLTFAICVHQVIVSFRSKLAILGFVPVTCLMFSYFYLRMKIERTIADINVRSHTFAFIPPSHTDLYKIPNPCTTCHTNMKTADAEATLMSWPNVSAWRVGR